MATEWTLTELRDEFVKYCRERQKEAEETLASTTMAARQKAAYTVAIECYRSTADYWETFTVEQPLD